MKPIFKSLLALAALSMCVAARGSSPSVREGVTHVVSMSPPSRSGYCPGNLDAQAQAATSKTPDPIPSIRQQYAAINKRAGRYRKVKKQLSGFSTEGGEMTAYFDGPALVKIVATNYGEMGRTVEEYYYLGGQLIFVFEKVLHYDRPLSGKVVRTTENRYYFHEKQLLRWIDEAGMQASVTDLNALAKERDLLEFSDKYVAGARSKNRVIE